MSAPMSLLAWPFSRRLGYILSWWCCPLPCVRSVLLSVFYVCRPARAAQQRCDLAVSSRSGYIRPYIASARVSGAGQHFLYDILYRS
jgi:hypothetical protein